MFDVHHLTIGHELQHWPSVTRTYIEKFDLVIATSQINLPDLHTMAFGHKLRHWPIVTLTYIEKFDSITANCQIILPVGYYLLSIN